MGPRIRGEPTVGVHVDPLTVDQGLLAFCPFLDESSCRRDRTGCRIVHSMAKLQPLQTTLLLSPVGDCRRGLPDESASASLVVHPVPEPATAVLLIDGHAHQTDQAVTLVTAQGSRAEPSFDRLVTYRFASPSLVMSPAAPCPSSRRMQQAHPRRPRAAGVAAAGVRRSCEVHRGDRSTRLARGTALESQLVVGVPVHREGRFR